MTTNLRLLIVEPRDADAFLLQRMLSNAPEVEFDVVRVETADEAIALLQHSCFDGVILDLDEPDDRGFDTLLTLRTLSPTLAVLVLTERADEEYGLQIVECGAQDFIAKDMINGQLLFRSIRYAIARQRQISHFKAVANTDALTGLANRRALDQRLSESIARFETDQEPFSFMILDIDHFKQFNDSFGHRVGDYVLSELGALFKNVLPQETFCARYGGEELAMLMADATVENSIGAMREVLGKIASHDFSFEKCQHSVTASAGLTFAIDGDNACTLIQRADTALYQAKKNGRNCGEVNLSVDPSPESETTRNRNPAWHIRPA